MRTVSPAVNTTDLRFPDRLMLNAEAMHDLLDTKAFDRLPRALREYVLTHPDLGDGAKLLYLNYLYPAACRNADFAVHRSAARIMADLGFSSSTFSRYCQQLETARLIHRVHRFAAGKRALVAIHVGLPYLDGQAMLRATHDRKTRQASSSPRTPTSSSAATRPAAGHHADGSISAASAVVQTTAPSATPPALPAVDITDPELRQVLGSVEDKLAARRQAAPRAPNLTSRTDCPATGQPVDSTDPGCSSGMTDRPISGQTTPSYTDNKSNLELQAGAPRQRQTPARRNAAPRLLGSFFMNTTKPGPSAIPCARNTPGLGTHEQRELDTWVRSKLAAMGYMANDIERLRREIGFAIRQGHWQLGPQGATRACVKLIHAGRWQTPRGMH